MTTEPCHWCGRAIRQEFGVWLAVKGAERDYDPNHCDANTDDGRHEPSPTGRYASFDNPNEESHDHTE